MRDTAPDASGTRAPVAVLLAAGSGSRFDGERHKLLTPLAGDESTTGSTVFARSARTVATVVRDGSCSGLVVVTGAADVTGELEAVAAELGIAAQVHVAHNPDFADGQATSIRVGLDAVSDLGASVAVIGLADQPDVLADTWRAVAASAGAANATPISVATYDGRPRNPVALHRSVWDRLPTEGDTGARDLIRLHPDLVTPVPSLGSPADIDTVEDLRRWQST